jgi:hypothetical protein
MSAISYYRVMRKDALNRRLDSIDKQTVGCYMYLVSRLLYSLATSLLALDL